MSTAFSMTPLFRQSIGFDRFNDLFESAMRNETSSSYPPYNVEKHADDQYRIVIAAAGFQDEDLDLQVERGVLTVTCLLYTSPSPRDLSTSRMPSSA